ncbi:hypothetical protein NKR19_g4125 [Coniochaeta hoffmannii]|uniref:Uncharacterized protein n=1 Tax=Coniochaeta hoffmannii TaxID=91930 RepID=A0AA38VXG6_9PEZI|nr:hypothetical protein NKR19_g4125 [Coniochaeta hoffmannii]
MSDTACAKEKAAPAHEKTEKNNNTRGAPDKFNGLTQRDLEILSHAWGAMKTQPEIDYQKLADACGMTNPRSASNAWSMIKKKLFINVPAPNKGDGTAAPATPGKKRKAPAAKKATVHGNDANDNDAAVKAEPGAEDGDDIQAEASPPKKARSRAKPKPRTPAKVKDEDKDGSDAGADEKEEDVKPPVKEKAKPKAKPAAKPKATAKAKKEAAAKEKEPEPKAEEDSEDGPDGADSVPAAATEDAEEGSVDGEV